MNQCFGCNTCASADKPLEGFIRELPMETSHHRVEGQSTKCGFGLQGLLPSLLQWSVPYYAKSTQRNLWRNSRCDCCP